MRSRLGSRTLGPCGASPRPTAMLIGRHLSCKSVRSHAYSAISSCWYGDKTFGGLRGESRDGHCHMNSSSLDSAAQGRACCRRYRRVGSKVKARCGHSKTHPPVEVQGQRSAHLDTKELSDEKYLMEQNVVALKPRVATRAADEAWSDSRAANMHRDLSCG